VLEQIFVTLIGFLGRGEARELPHGVKFAAISGGMNAARVGRLAGIAEVIFFAPVFRKIGFSVETANGHTGNRGEAGVAMLVEICVGGRADGPLGRFFQRGRESLLRPVFFGLEGWRFSKTSAIGLSATCGFDGFFDMRSPVVYFDDRERRARGKVSAGHPYDRSVRCVITIPHLSS